MPKNIYKSPPITEAVIGITFKSSLDEDTLSSLHPKLTKYYPIHQTVANLSVAVNIINNNYETPNTETQKEDIYRLTTPDQTQILVLSKSEFIFSQLAPYKGWDNLFERFTRDWSILKRTTGFREIARVGVRYINRIDIPMENNQVDHQKYLNIYPSLPKPLDFIDGYAIQISTKLKNIGCNLKINSGAVPSPLLNHISFLVDLDVSNMNAPPQKDEDLYTLLMGIRKEKNIVFEECITDFSRKLFL
jgi:uncharacterized protein (TIGR04255 family)